MSEILQSILRERQSLNRALIGTKETTNTDYRAIEEATRRKGSEKRN